MKKIQHHILSLATCGVGLSKCRPLAGITSTSIILCCSTAHSESLSSDFGLYLEVALLAWELSAPFSFGLAFFIFCVSRLGCNTIQQLLHSARIKLRLIRDTKGVVTNYYSESLLSSSSKA